MSESEFYRKVGSRSGGSHGGGRRHSESDTIAPSAGFAASDQPAERKFGQGVSEGRRRWAEADGQFWAVNSTREDLPAGLYRTFMVPQIGPMVKRVDVQTDGLLLLPEHVTAEILEEFKKFWSKKEEFRKRGFLYKRGFLTWGPPASGKTSLFNLMFKYIIEDLGGIVCHLDRPAVAANCLQMIRSVEPERPIVAVLEDFEDLVRSYGASEYLSLLDGENQIDNVVFLASTNFPEDLDKRFVDRPSRFDRVWYIGMPGEAARRMYLSAKEPSLSAEELEEWVRRSEGFSIAHLREMIVAVKCMDMPLDEVIERLEFMQERAPTSDDPPDDGTPKPGRKEQFGIIGNAKR